MINGRARAFSAHMERLVTQIPATAAYEDEIRARLRSAGPDVFVTILAENHGFNVEARPSRPFSPTITVDAHGHADERESPGVRGRDQAWQSSTHAASRRRGADSGLLINERGRAISPIEGSFLVLRGDMVFHSTHERALPSVSEAPVMNYLLTQGATPKARPDGFDIEEMRSAEVWFISSFRGIQLVEAWVEYGSVFRIGEKRPVAAFMPTFSEVNQHLWDEAETV